MTDEKIIKCISVVRISGFCAYGLNFSCCSQSLDMDELFQVNALVAETERPNWWERTAAPNMIDIHSTQEFAHELSHAGDRLVIVEFYGTWCASCRALFPKVISTYTPNVNGLLLLSCFRQDSLLSEFSCLILFIRIQSP